MTAPFAPQFQHYLFKNLKLEFPAASEGQLRRMAVRMSELDSYRLCVNENIALPARWEVALIAHGIAKSDPEMLRPVPTADEVVQHLEAEAAKAGTPLLGEAKLRAKRRWDAAGPEERLAAMPFSPEQPTRPAETAPAADKVESAPPAKKVWQSPSDVSLDDLKARWPNVDLDARSAETRMTMARTLWDERRNGSRDDRELAVINSKDPDTLSAADRMTKARLENPAAKKVPRY